MFRRITDIRTNRAKRETNDKAQTEKARQFRSVKTEYEIRGCEKDSPSGQAAPPFI